MNNVILDASALLALVNQESGQELVAEVLSRSLVSAVNLSEVVAKLMDQAIPEDNIREILAALDLSVVPFDEEQGIVAGQLRSLTKKYGLSLGDRACLALGLQTQHPVMTADRDWAKLQISLEIQLIR